MWQLRIHNRRKKSKQEQQQQQPLQLKRKTLGRNYLFFHKAFVKRRNSRWCAPRAFWNFAAKIWCANGRAMEKTERKTSAAQNGRLRVILSHSFGPITNRNLYATWRKYTGETEVWFSDHGRTLGWDLNFVT